MDAGAYVTELVRAADPERYLATLYAPEDRRRGLSALYGFNSEISSVRDRVREPMAGEIRLQWWRDAIAAAEEEASGNPVADELRATIARYRLPRQAFDDMLAARVFDLYDDPMPDRTTLEGYCGETASALIQLASLILDPAAASDRGELAGHAGCALALTGMLRLLPIHRSRGQCYVPRDLLGAAGLTPEEFVFGEPGEAHRRAVAAMTALAQEHYAAFLRGVRGLTPSLRPAYLPLAPTGHHLDKIQRTDAFRVVGSGSAFARHLSIFRRALTGWR
jgi:15-cis-phytoene synthase